MTHSFAPGTTSVPLRPFGGTCLSGPPFNAGSSIAFPRGLKSRAESGAKAPHSIWSAAIHRRFLVKALAFTTLPLALFSHDHEICARVEAIHELPLHPWRDPLVGAGFWRDRFVGSDAHRLMTHSFAPGTTSVPLRPFGGTCLSGPPFNAGSSIAFPRGLKSRAESGAKAPHSIWSAAIHHRFLVKALAFTTLALAVFCREHPKLCTDRGNS